MLIEQAHQQVATAVNIAEVFTKYSIGKYIVEDEHQGKVRAEYGKQVLKALSARLTERFGEGWSAETLKLCRRFFVVYSNSVNNVYPIQGEKGKHCLPNSDSITRAGENDNHWLSNPKFTLSWSHYLILMPIVDPDARSFYEIECTQQQWSVRQLSRHAALKDQLCKVAVNVTTHHDGLRLGEFVDIITLLHAQIRLQRYEIYLKVRLSTLIVGEKVECYG